MFSECATENAIRAFVTEIARELQKNAGNEEACKVLRKLGRFALTKFEWDEPTWAAQYAVQFRPRRRTARNT